MSDPSIMSNRERLIYMANQIARNLTAPREEDAVTAVADHIASFWDPRMRAQIHDVLANDPAALSDRARRAVERLQAGPPPHHSRATIFSAVDEPGRSDAG